MRALSAYRPQDQAAIETRQEQIQEQEPPATRAATAAVESKLPDPVDPVDPVDPPERVQPKRKPGKKKAQAILGMQIRNWPGRLTKNPQNDDETLRGTVLKADVVQRTAKGRYVVRVFGQAPANRTATRFEFRDDLQSTGKSYSAAQLRAFSKLTVNQAAK